jgi:hypothetical protein
LIKDSPFDGRPVSLAGPVHVTPVFVEVLFETKVTARAVLGENG